MTENESTQSTSTQAWPAEFLFHSIYLKRRRGNTTSIETPVIAHEGMNVK